MGDALLAKIGTWLWALLPAAIGSGISLLFKKNDEAPSSKLMAFVIFIAGVSVAHFFGHGTVDYFHINHDSYAATCIVITWGLFGLSLISEISNRLPGAMRAVFDQIPETLKVLRKKFLGE